MKNEDLRGGHNILYIFSKRIDACTHNNLLAPYKKIIKIIIIIKYG